MVQNGKPLGQMLITLGLDTTAFSSSLTGATRATKTATREMAAGFKIVDAGGNKIDALGFKNQALTKVVAAQRNELGYLKKAYDDTLDAQGNATSTTAKVAQKYNDAAAKLAGYEHQMVQTAGQLAEMKVLNEGLTGSLNKFGGVLEKRGKQMADFGDTMTKRVTLPIIAGVGLAVKAAMDWESAFAGVRKTNDEVVDSNGNVVYSYADLEDGLRGLAKELPATHREIAEVGQAAGQLGIQTEKVTSFTKTMIDLGESTNLSAEQAATSFARLANITNMSQDDFDRLGSSVVKVGNNFATTESEITELAMRLAGAGSQIGMSEADIVGLAGALSSVGVEAQAGGTALSKTMINMKVATETGYQQMLDLEKATGMTRRELELMSANSSKDFTALAASMGKTSGELNKIIKSGNNLEAFAAVANMSAKDFKQAFETDAVGALGAFIEGLGAAEEKGTSAIQLLDDMGISEVRLRDSLLRAGNASELFARSVEMSNDAWEENTALSTEANIRYETLESQLGMLRNEANDVAITFGGPFVGALKDGLVTARPLIERLADMAKAFSDMDPEMQQMIIKTLAITTAAGPLLSVTGRVAQGIGGLTTKSIGFLGVMARKKTIKEFTAQLAMGSTDIMSWGSAAGTAAGATGKFGGAAATAAGAKGVGAMTTQLGLLGPVGWGIVGAGGLLAVGYGAWKLWGEEAYNAGQRTKRWGTDVGEATDEALTEIQGYSKSAIGEFSLLEQGFDTNISSMVSNFESMGQSIQTELTDQINAFRESIDMLPEEIRGAAQEIVDEAVKTREDTLQIVEENNKRVAEIRERAANENRENSILEAGIIRDLMQESAAEYLKITIKDADDRQTVMDALTGNVAEATEEQAKAWIQSLGKQRQASNQDYSQKLDDYKSFLDDQGILNTEEGQKLVELFEKSKDASSDALDAQIALIAEKYPELANEVFFANGQLIDGMDEASKEMVKSNEQIIDNATKLTKVMAKSAEENAELLSWKADEAKRGAKVWNELILDPKTGEVKTNVREAVIEAAENTQTWNNIRFQLKNADLDSNAKQIIGEAAIQNGWWDGMSWEEKQIIIDDQFSETIIRALDDSGKWNELELEEQTALMYSNSPEKMTEALTYLGLWDEYETEIKQVDADNYGFMKSILESEEKMNYWQGIDPEVKDLLADNYDITQKLFESEEMLNRFKELPDENKLILGDNLDLLAAVLESEEFYNRWMGLPENDKKFLGDNTDLLSTVLSSEEGYKRWLNLPTEEKKILGNNIDLLSKILKSEEEYNSWRNLPEFEKKLKVNNIDAVDPTIKAHGLLRDYKGFDPGSKNLPITTNADSTKSALDRARDAWNKVRQLNGSKTFTTRYETVGQAPAGIGPYATRNAKGTNYHPGGPMIVNDQLGSKFRELIQRPDGTSYIPFGRNVLLPDEPVGTKVFKASLTERIVPGIPQYANGVGIPRDSSVIQSINRVREATREREPSYDLSQLANVLNLGMDQMRGVLEQIKNYSADLAQKEQEFIFNIEGRTIARAISDHTDEEEGRRIRLTGRGLA
ncbi:phage tail tape measure protein [Marinilactibacillus sp. XAAS-LB27]|uniref:phage tail tape measure protein n=1 Tax=Marinilactibacillus sp. XAAS-LB27 TaxID=3114538 RepID=UPI002E19BD6A|nr:phage tail tape measure protein [Marinilactibacillus sp. XAAS-LB27]